MLLNHYNLLSSRDFISFILFQCIEGICPFPLFLSLALSVLSHDFLPLGRPSGIEGAEPWNNRDKSGVGTESVRHRNHQFKEGGHDSRRPSASGGK